MTKSKEQESSVAKKKLGKKTAVAILVFIIVPVLIALAGAEILIRKFSPTGYVTPEILKKLSLQYERGVFTRNVLPRMEQKTKEENDAPVYVNAKGYRGGNFEVEKAKGKIRIMFYGGSSVFDIAVPEGKDWPHRVEDLLKKKNFNQVEIINAGTPANKSFESMGRLFTEGHLFNPDYVVLSNEWNDIKYFRSDEPLLRQWNTVPETRDPLQNYQNFLDRFLSENSQLYVRLRTRYYLAKHKVTLEGVELPGDYSDKISDIALKQYKLNIEMFVDLARNIDSTPVLMIEPRLVSVDNSDRQKSRISYRDVKLTHRALTDAFKKADEIIKEVAKEKNVILIETNILTGKDELFKDHVHTTEKGSEEVAKLVASVFEGILAKKK